MSAFRAVQKTNDAAQPFKQESNFWYLCGINEPDWLLIIDGGSGQSWLVMPDRTEVQRLFDGGLSADEARSISGVDEVIASSEASELMQRLARRHQVVHTLVEPSYAAQLGFELNPSFAKTRRMLETNFKEIVDVRKTIAALRAVKQPIEIKAIQTAVNCTVSAFQSVRDHMRSFKTETDIEAEFSYVQRKKGATGHAYEPIVAAGMNACTLHYSQNRSALKNRQLVLMDVGAEYNSYAADITRTYARGEPTKRQKQVHGAVESAHHQIIALLKPHLGVQEYQAGVDVIMKEALDSIELDSDESSLRRYFPHAISHGLGIDVHDSLGAPKYFQENMVLTVEPGIYIPEEGIGVRIEDDILITATGNSNLSSRLSTGL